MKLKSIWIYLVLLLSLMQGCDPEVKHSVETIITDPQITVYPTNPAFSERDTINFQLFCQGADKVKWEVVSKPKWLILDYEFGEVNNEGAIVKATVRQDLVQQGDYFGDISFASEGAGVCEASLALFAAKYPDPYFNPSELIFNEDENEKTIELLNKGEGALVYGFGMPTENWIDIASFDSYVYPQGHRILQVSVNKQNLEPGTKESNIIFYFNNYKDSLNIPITVHIPEIREVEFASDTLFLYSKDESKVLMFNNTGNLGFDWVLESSSPQLICETTTGSIKKNDFATVKIKVDRKNLQDGEHNFTLTLKDKDGNFINSIPVFVRNFTESINEIDGDIVDAKYNKSLDRLIIITQSPDELQVYNIDNHTITKHNLSHIPKSLALSADGKFAAVGYEGGFSYINLETNKEELYYDLPFDCYDLVITSEGRIFFSISSEIFQIYYFDIKSKTLDKYGIHQDLYKVKLYLHPSEKYLFATRPMSSNVGIAKYNFENNSLVYDYKWTSERYLAEGKIWFLDDGKRMVTDTKTIYDYDYEKEFYLSYKGHLNIEKSDILSLDYSVSQQKVCLIDEVNILFLNSWQSKSVIGIHDYNYLSRIKILDLPHFATSKKYNEYDYVQAYAQYCFFNSSGNKIVSILNSNYNKPSEGRWGIYVTKY